MFISGAINCKGVHVTSRVDDVLLLSDNQVLMLTPDMLLISKADEQTGDFFDTLLLRFVKFEAERGKAERERARERGRGRREEIQHEIERALGREGQRYQKVLKA